MLLQVPNNRYVIGKRQPRIPSFNLKLVWQRIVVIGNYIGSTVRNVVDTNQLKSSFTDTEQISKSASREDHTMAPPAASRGTVVFITGATQGLGLQIARVLSTPTLHPGYQVIIGALVEQDGADAIARLLAEDSTRLLSTVTIDVTSDSSIGSAAAYVASKFGHLDVLINNAGVLLDGLQDPSTSRALFEKTFQVNVFGAAAVTEAFVPLLEKSISHCPRIVYMSSRLGSLTTSQDVGSGLDRQWFAVYRSSKTALNMLMLHYSRLYHARGWKVNACCPGWSRTEMTNLQDDPTGRMGSVEDGALNAVRLATMENEGETGTFSNKEGAVEW